MLLEIDEVVLPIDWIKRIESGDNNAVELAKKEVSADGGIELYLHNFVPPDEFGDEVGVVTLKWLEKYNIVKSVEIRI